MLKQQYLIKVLLILLTTLASVCHAQTYPEIGFEPRPNYYKAKQVTLTFEDGPGWRPQITHHILDILNYYGVKATFFVNSGENSMGQEGWSALARIIDEHHEVGSHTRNHYHLEWLSNDELKQEIFGVEEDIKSELGYSPRITLFRAPYGEPYITHWNNTVLNWEPSAPDYNRVAPLVAKRMFHVGWNIDSNDWRCGYSGYYGAECVAGQVIDRLLEGKYGNILLNGNKWSVVDALPIIMDYLLANGYEVISSEQAICNKYGATSANVIDHELGCEL